MTTGAAGMSVQAKTRLRGVIYMTERERMRQREIRAKRRRAQRRKELMTRILVAFLVIAVIVTALIVVNIFKGKKSGNIPVQTSGTGNTAEMAAQSVTVQEENAETVELVGETAKPEEAAVEATAEVQQSAPVINEDGIIFVGHSESVSPSTAEEALGYANFFAAQYDYDRAIETIKMLSGYESNSALTDAIARYTAEKDSCVPVDVTTIPHVFFHSLLNDDRGLRVDVVGSDRAWRNDAAMTTANEYDHLMQQMYDAGYVMVSLDDMCIKTKNDDGSTSVAKNTSLMLPPDKKAFVLSVDDLSYYHTYGIGTQGYATKLVLDDEGRVRCEYTNENGETLIGDYDVVPRMDSFIREHPDFSYHNARGTVALTGYNGVFGYRTNDYYKDINNEHLDKDQIEWLEQHPDFDWDEDVAMATRIADAMKEEGWTFASHTYGHWNASTKSVDALKGDNERWMTVNHNIVGDIDKIIFAFGGDIGTVNNYTADNEKFQYFKSQGYVIYCNVDGHIGWTEFGPDYMRTGRVALDGFTMYQYMTPEGGSHNTYAKAYEILGIHDVDEFFNPNRIVPIEGE